MYPLDFHPDSISLSGMECHLDTLTAESWDISDVEDTPRVTSEAFEKFLA